MRIVFMGTPDFAVPSLHALLDAGHEVAAVYTQPDKPQGRKQILTAPPVKELALAHGIPVFQPDTLKKEEEQARLRKQRKKAQGFLSIFKKPLRLAKWSLPRRN